MKIKVTEKNREKIEAALLKVNGKATAHTYYEYDSINRLAEIFRTKLDALLLRKDQLSASATAVSGYSVANCYSYSRIATRVTLETFPSGIFLIDIKSEQIWEENGSDLTLTLTQTQSVQAHRRFDDKFLTLKA